MCQLNSPSSREDNWHAQQCQSALLEVSEVLNLQVLCFLCSLFASTYSMGCCRTTAWTADWLPRCRILAAHPKSIFLLRLAGSSRAGCLAAVSGVKLLGYQLYGTPAWAVLVAVKALRCSRHAGGPCQTSLACRDGLGCWAWHNSRPTATVVARYTQCTNAPAKPHGQVG